MADKQNIGDLAVLGAYLERHVSGFSGLISCDKFGTGQSNPTYHLKAASGEYVLRAKPPGELLKSAHQVDREFRVMQALADSDVAVPQMFHLADDENPLGRMFFVMRYHEGRIFWDPALPELEKAERGLIYDGMNKTLAALHMVNVETVGLSDFGRPGNYFARQTDRWIKQYKASVLEPNRHMDRLMDWLLAEMPEDDSTATLVHGDYRLDNMIFAPNSPTVIAMLDWELSTLGHPLADLAYQCMQWRLPHQAGMRGLGGLDRTALGIPEEVDYVAAYCARRGIPTIENWNFYLAFSYFRLAAILQGVVRRAHDGNASNPERAREMAKAVPVLAAMANDLF
ncbi:MAG: aminoglycoside phosphotransferase (APT) family kinase protein [Paracoccaceae bacterium]|jgi:aminoglycoside phosphotransferase (APT) family kinase protein